MGTFGDFLSGAFQFLTVGGLIYTIYIQSQTLKKTSEELELSRKELVQSTEALQTQAKESKNKTQADIFFGLLKVFRDSLDKLYAESSIPFHATSKVKCNR